MKTRVIWRRLLALAIFGMTVSGAPLKRPSTEHRVYFEHSPNELHVYKLYGRIDGRTIMILGGIQGDEPGGFLSADLYPDLVLEKGNLIVIPRANFHSIILNNRGVNGDMNRRFENKEPVDIDDQIVQIIKNLMAESDMLLNLHDGWGFYRETYIDEWRNPRRFGQSIIADAAVYFNGRDTLYLKKMTEQVIRQVNAKIENSEHHLRFMNTDTFNPRTDFPEQRKSATYYALSQFGIPAFGLESSKNLEDNELKIRYHNYSINAFMDLLGIEPEYPAVICEPPRLIYVLISINDQHPIMIDGSSPLRINKGDRVKVTHIQSNYARGLSCDFVGYGSDNDFQRTFTISKDTRLVIKKDSQSIAAIELITSPAATSRMVYIFEVNNSVTAISHDETLSLKRSDRFKIVNVAMEGLDPSKVEVNLKGYVPPTAKNTGEDRGYWIRAGQLTWKKYSLNGQGKIYPIVVSLGDREISRAFIAIED